jgi:hypothetical protein
MSHRVWADAALDNPATSPATANPRAIKLIESSVGTDALSAYAPAIAGLGT